MSTKLRTVYVPPYIPGKDIDVLILGEAPSTEEEKQRVPFVGPSGKILRHFLNLAGYDMNKTAIANAVPFRVEGNKAPSKQTIELFREPILKLIQDLKPKLIIALGSSALYSLLGHNDILEFRGYVTKAKFGEYECLVGCTIHPALIIRVPEYAVPFFIELLKFKNVMLNGLKTTEVKYEIIRSEHDFRKLLERKEEFVIIDCETTGYKYYDSKIICIGLGFGDDIFIVAEETPKEEVMRELLRSNRTFVGYNIKFDLQFLKELTGEFPKKVIDAMIGLRLLNENLNPLGPASLSYFSKVFTDKGFYELEIKKYVPSKKKGSFADIPREVLYKYLAHDIACTKDAWELCERNLTTEKHMWDVLNRLTLILAASEYEGIIVNEKMLGRLISEREIKLNELTTKLSTWKDINWNSSVAVRKVLFEDLKLEPAMRTPTDAPSTSEQALERLRGTHEVVDLLLERRAVAKELKLMQGIKDACYKGRVHPNVNLVGTLTGRTTCSNPNLQQIPREGEFRSVFCPDPEHVWVEVDYSRAELYMMAYFSGCKTLLEDLARDIHTEVAIKVLKCEPDRVNEEVRMMAKAINFGICYGATAKGLTERVKGLKLAEAEKILEEYKKNYPEVFETQEKMKKVVLSSSYVTYFSGRKRHFLDVPNEKCRSELFRKAVNSVIQGSVADLTLESIALTIERFKKEGIRGRYLLVLHDAGHFSVHIDDLKRACQIIKEVFTREFSPGKSIPVEIICSSSWGAEELEWSEEKADEIIDFLKKEVKK